MTLAPTPAEAQQTERFRLAGNDVAVFSLAGETRVEAGTGADVEVEVTRGGSDAARLRAATGRIGRQETLRIVFPGDRVVYSRLNRGSRTQLRVREDGTFGRGGNGGRRVTIAGSGDGIEAHADLRIRVPAGRRVAVHQGTGRVWVGNVDGELRVEGSSATVETERTRGSLTVNVGSGRVRVSAADGVVDVDTGSGSVELNGIRGARLRVDTGSGAVSGSGIAVGELNVDVGSGSVRLSDLHFGSGVVDTGSGSVQLSLSGPARSLQIDTGSGGVTLDVPRSLGANLDVRTGSGGIRVDLPVEELRRSRNRLEGRVGDGTADIRIRTGSGGVRLRES